MFYLLTVVTEDGTGRERPQGDRYEVHACTFDEAVQKVLGLEGSNPYTHVVNAWAKRVVGWDELDPVTGSLKP